MTPKPDLPTRLLAFAIRHMPPQRSEWARAMSGELAAIQQPRMRWTFALGCTWVAITTPGTGGLLHRMKRTTLISAAISTVLVAPLAFLEVVNGTYSHFPYPLFVLLWLVPAAFVITGAPIVRAARAGESILATPGVFILRVALLLLAALFWSALVIDQMPCFLGVPNCD